MTQATTKAKVVVAKVKRVVYPMADAGKGGGMVPSMADGGKSILARFVCLE